MAKEQKKTSAKGVRKDIEQLLEKSLVQLKEMLGEKKFSGRVKKAARLLSEGVVVKEKKEKPVKAETSSEKTAKPAPVKAKQVAAKAAVKKPSKAVPVKKKTTAPAKA